MIHSTPELLSTSFKRVYRTQSAHTRTPATHDVTTTYLHAQNTRIHERRSLKPRAIFQKSRQQSQRTSAVHCRQKKRLSELRKNHADCPLYNPTYRDTIAHCHYQPLRKFANVSVTFDPQGTQAPGDSGVTIRVATYVTSTSCREDEIPAPPTPHTLKTSLPNETTAVHATTRSKWRLISCKMLSNVIGS